jgi:hypothetical protein
MTIAQAAQREAEFQRAKEEARLRKAIRLVMDNPGDLRAALIYVYVSREGK